MKKPTDMAQFNAVESLLNIDSVAVVEEIAKTDFEALPLNVQAAGVGLEINKNALLHKMMVETGDFSMGDTYDRRRLILEREGFETIHAVQFNPGPWEGKQQPDRLFSIWANREFGLVLVQATYTSYESDGVRESCDYAKCYFCWRPHDVRNPHVIGLGSGGFESIAYPKWQSMDPPPGSKDMFFTPDDLYFRGYQTGDRGLIHKLQSMLLHGTFMPQWPEWDDRPNPLGDMFCTALDYKIIEASHPSGPEHIAQRSAISCQVYDSLPVLHSIMNIKPTWRI